MPLDAKRYASPALGARPLIRNLKAVAPFVISRQFKRKPAQSTPIWPGIATESPCCCPGIYNGVYGTGGRFAAAGRVSDPMTLRLFRTPAAFVFSTVLLASFRSGANCASRRAAEPLRRRDGRGDHRPRQRSDHHALGLRPRHEGTGRRGAPAGRHDAGDLRGPQGSAAQPDRPAALALQGQGTGHHRRNRADEPAERDPQAIQPGNHGRPGKGRQGAGRLV